MRTTKQIKYGLTCLAALAALAVGASSVQAQAWPERPIKLLVGYAPGGGIDILGRFLAQRLGEQLGQQIVVENRAGASGSIAARALAAAPPDGHTLFMGESATLVAPALQPVNYDPVRDFAPVARIGALVYGVAVHPEVPAQTLDELIALIRKQPGALNYGSPGVGNVVHLGTERLKREIRLELAHVPYKGGGPMLADLMSGHIPIGMTSMASLVGPERGGRIRLVGVTSITRSDIYPGVQSLSEIQPGFEAISNIYVVAPARTSVEIIRSLNTAINAIMQTEEARQYFSQQGSLVRTGTPEALGQLIVSEVSQWRALVEELGLAAQ